MTRIPLHALVDSLPMFAPDLYRHDIALALRFGGPGAGFGRTLKRVSGSGSRYLFGFDSNAVEVTKADLGRDFKGEGMSSITAASGHAAAAAGRLQEILFLNGQLSRVAQMATIGIAGAVKSRGMDRPKRGYCGNFALRYLSADRMAIETKRLSVMLP